MSVITHLMGRVTKDPVMQQGKNNGTEYISLDLAVTQRSQNSQNGQNTETMYYQCFFNKHLADRLLKANVKKGTCLYVYGDLEIHPFIYQQGQKAGQAGVNAKVNVKDWQFCLSNKPENESGTAPGMNGNAMPNNGGAPMQGGGYQNPGVPNGGTYPGAAGAPNAAPNMGAGVPAGGYTAAPPAPQASPATYAGNRNYAAPGGTAPQTYGGVPASGYSNDGFSNVPEYQAGQLPFN